MILSSESERVLSAARYEAVGLHHQFTGTEHLLLGLLTSDDPIAAPLLAKHGIVPAEVRAQVARAGGAGDREVPSQPLTARAKQVLGLAQQEAEDLNDESVRPEHLLLGIVRQATGVAALVLQDMGVELSELREEVLEARAVHLGLTQNGVESDSEAGESGPSVEPVPPVCPSCKTALADVLATTTIAPAGAVAATRRRPLPRVTVIYCGLCGHTLSAEH